MSRYDGLIIPRSYSEYINKTDAATLQQALQLPGVLSGAVAAGDNKAVKSSAVNNALANYTTKSDLAECTKIPYLSFNPTSKVWTWHDYNNYDTNKPVAQGKLVAIFLEDNLQGNTWIANTTGVVNYNVQNTNSAKSANTKCIGVLVESFIDILS